MFIYNLHPLADTATTPSPMTTAIGAHTRTHFATANARPLPFRLPLHPRRRHLIFSSYFLFLFLFLFLFHPSSSLLLLPPPPIRATSSLLSPLQSAPNHLLSGLRSRNPRLGGDLRRLGKVKDEESILCHPPRVLHHCPCCSTSPPLLHTVGLQFAHALPVGLRLNKKCPHVSQTTHFLHHHNTGIESSIQYH